MRKTFLSLLAASFAMAATAMATTAMAAEHNIRPGLWEVTTTSGLLKLVPHIPPNQMEQLRDLARQNGIDMPEIRNGAATSKVCITKEMADRKIPPNLYEHESGCAAKNVTHAGNSYKMDLVCDGARLKGNGKAEGSFTSPESFTGRTEFTGDVQGNPVNERADTTGRWIGASCGSVKAPQ
jgi:hypothetical protein